MMAKYVVVVIYVMRGEGKDQNTPPKFFKGEVDQVWL